MTLDELLQQAKAIPSIPRVVSEVTAELDRDEPDARRRILAATGGVGTALAVQFLLAQGNVGLGGDFSRIALRRVGCDVLQIGEIRDGVVLGFVSHYATALFLRFIEATSSVLGFWPSCGCSVPL